eukprot:jgi/Chlat1/3917/Chrsp26S04026
MAGRQDGGGGGGKRPRNASSGAAVGSGALVAAGGNAAAADAVHVGEFRQQCHAMVQELSNALASFDAETLLKEGVQVSADDLKAPTMDEILKAVIQREYETHKARAQASDQQTAKQTDRTRKQKNTQGADARLPDSGQHTAQCTGTADRPQQAQNNIPSVPTINAVALEALPIVDSNNHGMLPVRATIDKYVELLLVATDVERPGLIASLRSQRERDVASAPLSCLREKKRRMDEGKLRAPPLNVASKFVHAAQDTVALREVDPTEVVLTVSFHHAWQLNRKVQEFLVLGSQTLVDLQRKVYCLSERIISTGNNEPTQPFFFIEGVFYVQGECLEVSEILKWAQAQQPTSEEWRIASMQEGVFERMRVVPGRRYLYSHQGNCEHAIEFHDIRLLHPSDPQHVELYPHTTFLLGPRQRKCSVCSVHAASRVTHRAVLAPENPAFLCAWCYRALFYDKDGKLREGEDTLEVYPYFHE